MSVVQRTVALPHEGFANSAHRRAGRNVQDDATTSAPKSLIFRIEGFRICRVDMRFMQMYLAILKLKGDSGMLASA